MTQLRKFSEQFKREAVELTQQPGAVVRSPATSVSGPICCGVGTARWRPIKAKPFEAPARHAIRRWPHSSANWPRSRRSGISCAMRQRSSPGNRTEISDDSALSRCVSCATVVSLTEGLARWFPCVGEAPGQCAVHATTRDCWRIPGCTMRVVMARWRRRACRRNWAMKARPSVSIARRASWRKRACTGSRSAGGGDASRPVHDRP